MAFARVTGRKKTRKCVGCGLAVDHEERLVYDVPRNRKHWSAIAHRAPCGAWCCCGANDHKEIDIHIPAFGKCPRCGESDTLVVHVIERADGIERVVFLKYLPKYLRRIGFRIELETKQASRWCVKHRWGTNHPDSLEKTVNWAENYVPWLKQSQSTRE